MEDYYLGHATERIFLPLLKLTMPEIVDYHMPAEGIFHNLVFVSIDKQYPGQAYKVMHALWGQGLMSLAKVLVVVDKDVNVHDPDEAWWVALNHIDPKRDVRFSMGPIDVLDHSSRAFTYGTKMGIDATKKWPEEGFARELARGDRDGCGDEGAGWTRSGRRSACERGDGGSRGAARRTDRCGRVTARALRELREAAAHGVRAALRAGRGDPGQLRRTGDALARRMGGAGLHRGAVRRDGLQPDCRPRDRREEPAHGDARAAPGLHPRG